MLLFGNVLKKLRLEKGISQSELASDLGLAKSAICMYELCQRMPKADSTLKQIAEYFGVSLDYLLGLSEDRFPKDSIQQANEEMADIYFLMRKNKKLADIVKILCKLPPERLDAVLLFLKALE